MSVLSEDQIEDIKRRGTGPEPEKISALAQEYGVSTTTIRYHLNRPTASAVEFDEGEEVAEIEENPLAALLADEKSALLLNALVDKAVADRMAQMGVSALPGSTNETNASFEAFTKTIQHLIEMNAQQMPGYQKPLPAAEMDSRAEGLVEMRALLKKFEAEGRPPHYQIGNGKFYVDCVLHEPGEKIGMYLPPAEDMTPLNDEAKAVYAAMLQYIGGPSPWIGDRVADAMRTDPVIPIVGRGEARLKPGRVTVVSPSPQTEMTRRMQALGPNASSEMAARLATMGMPDTVPMGPFGG